jgi:hypothetical protein
MLRWAPASTLAGLLILSVLWLNHRPPAPTTPALNANPQSLTQDVLEVGEQMASTMPDALLAPLSEELQRLNRDLDQTGQFFLTSLP